ncbi:hypothetical protein Tco_0960395 [Tanacetum coccineum]
MVWVTLMFQLDGNTRNGGAIGQVHEANLHKLDANVPNDADFDIWLPLALVYEVKFHDVPLVVYTSDGLSLIATKIGLMMLDSYTNFMCLESWGRSSYATVLIEIDACNGFSYNMYMLNIWSSVDDCPKAPQRVVNKVDKGKGGSYGDDDEGSIEVKKNKPGGNNGGTKNFKPVLVKPKTQYRLKVNQSTEGNNGKKNVSTSGNSSKKKSMMNALTSGNGTFPLSNSFEAINVDDLANEEVESGNKVSMECVLVDDDCKPLEKVDYLDDHDSDDEVEPIDNEMENFLSS